MGSQDPNVEVIHEEHEGTQKMLEEKTDILYREEVYQLIGAAIEVHRELGPGFLEAVYQEALEIELKSGNIPFQAQRQLVVNYKNKSLEKRYEADFICYDKIVVEIKALDMLSTREEAQLLNYIKATGFRLGVLINFGSRTTLEWKRFIK